MHPGWRGWVRIEQAFYDFVHDRDDAFLGGGRFGAAEGLDAAGNAGASLGRRGRKRRGTALGRERIVMARARRLAAAARAAAEARPALLGAAAALAVVALALALGWFVVFSGLSEPVQFVYSSF